MNAVSGKLLGLAVAHSSGEHAPPSRPASVMLSPWKRIVMFGLSVQYGMGNSFAMVLPRGNRSAGAPQFRREWCYMTADPDSN
jgi:hypothetical protein